MLKKLSGIVYVSLLAALFSFNLQAAQFESVDDYMIHYNAINTSLLQPEVAKQYKINRSKNRALLNISVRKKGAGKMTQDTAVVATVKATVTNLNQQLQEINMREIREGDAIYYIGEFRVSDKETLDFVVTVDAENQGKEHQIKFRQEFFID